MKFILATMALLIAQPQYAQGLDEMREGWDVQSPEEIEKARLEIEKLFDGSDEPTFAKKSDRLKVLQKYNHLDPAHEVPSDLLAKAVTFFDANKKKFPNPDYMIIVNFKPRSDRFRFYLINITSGEVEKFHTTHGLYSDDSGFATVFGNQVGSGKSSLGFVRTGEVYSGRFGRSVRLDGLSKSNSNLRKRAVVLHGWDGVREDNVIQGLSWGCITLDWKVRDSVIDRVKEGALMYVGNSAEKAK